MRARHSREPSRGEAEGVPFQMVEVSVIIIDYYRQRIHHLPRVIRMGHTMTTPKTHPYPVSSRCRKGLRRH